MGSKRLGKEESATRKETSPVRFRSIQSYEIEEAGELCCETGLLIPGQ